MMHLRKQLADTNEKWIARVLQENGEIEPTRAQKAQTLVDNNEKWIARVLM